MSTINLLPEDYLHRRCQRRANVLCMVLFAVVMTGVGGAALVSEESTRRTIDVRDRVNANYNEAAKLLEQMRQLESRKRTGIEKADATASLLERVPRSYLLASITAALPEHTALMKMDLKPARKAAGEGKTKEKPKGGKYASKGEALAAAKAELKATKVQEQVLEVDLVGWAATDVEVARFIANLLQDPLLASVDLGYSQAKSLKTGEKDNEQELQVREFLLHLVLRSGVDVMDLVAEKPAEAAAPAAPAEEPPAVAEPQPAAAAPQPVAVAAEEGTEL